MPIQWRLLSSRAEQKSVMEERRQWPELGRKGRLTKIPDSLHLKHRVRENLSANALENRVSTCFAGSSGMLITRRARALDQLPR